MSLYGYYIQEAYEVYNEASYSKEYIINCIEKCREYIKDYVTKNKYLHMVNKNTFGIKTGFGNRNQYFVGICYFDVDKYRVDSGNYRSTSSDPPLKEIKNDIFNILKNKKEFKIFTLRDSNTPNGRKYDHYQIDLCIKKSSMVNEGKILDIFKKKKQNTNQVPDKERLAKRKPMVQLARREARNCINELVNKYPRIKKGFKIITNVYDSNIEEFLSGKDNWCCIIEYDAWEFTNNKARDDDKYEEFNKCLAELTNSFKNAMSSSNVKVDLNGDWDDGSIDIIDN